jgi:hypothetical protein
MKVLVTGSRDWTDQAMIDSVLDDLSEQHGPLTIIEGGARGADSCAKRWANTRDMECRTYRADWGRYRKGAGPVRNQQMLDEEHPDLVVAFHADLAASKGTADMVRRARKGGYDVFEYQP